MSFQRFVTPLSLLLWLAVIGCSDAEEASGDGLPSPDAGHDATGSLGCANFEALENVLVPQGGSVSIPRTGSLADSTLAVEVTGALAVDVTDATIVLYDTVDSPSEEGRALRTTCAGRTETFPVAIRSLTWSRVSAWDPNDGGPPGREYFSWWLDDDGSRLFVLGGYHYLPTQYTPASDMWTFDFTTSKWLDLGAVPNVPTLPGARVAQGSAPNSVYLFGGTAPTEDGSVMTPSSLRAFEYTNDEYTWADAPNSNGAPGSYTGAFLHDSKRNRWLSVCGLSSWTGVFCDVAEYTPGAGWAPLAVAAGAAPSGRFGFFYGYDEATDRVFIYGGSDGYRNADLAGDTWALELGETPARWVKLSDETPVSSHRRNGAFAIDPTGRRFFIWGGTSNGATSMPGIQVMSLDRGHEVWRHVATPIDVPPRTSGMGLHDPTRDRILWGFGNDVAVYTDLWAMAL
ncbi:MAG: hypothetical protein R3A78_00160 [Polyangiales bacterium]|nr:hypothetical protein [Myxococcales bacterium]